LDGWDGAEGAKGSGAAGGSRGGGSAADRAGDETEMETVFARKRTGSVAPPADREGREEMDGTARSKLGAVVGAILEFS
jgi:hypothetical protein